MERQETHKDDLFRFDYATCDIKKFIETVSEINELLLKVNPALAEKGVFTQKSKTNLLGMGMQFYK